MINEYPDNQTAGPAASQKDSSGGKPTYASIKEVYAQLQTVAVDEKRKADKRREFRYNEIDPDAMKADENSPLQEGDTFIPMRMADSAIAQEVPHLLRPLKETHTLLYFSNLADPSDPTMRAEARKFTNHCRHEDWIRPWIRLGDSSGEQGGACAETLFDKTKPAFFRVEYFERANLLIPSDATELEDLPVVGRRMAFYPSQLRLWVKKYGFSKEKVEKIIGRHSNAAQKAKLEKITIDRLYIKSDETGEVFRAYVSPDVEGFLRTNDPEPLSTTYSEWAVDPANKSLMRRPPSTYPLTYFPYRDTSEQQIFKTKGRVFYDTPIQEAAQNLWTGIVNAAIHASQIFGSGTDPSSGDLAETEKVRGNVIRKVPVNHWSPPMPPADLLNVVRTLAAEHKRDHGKHDVAAMSKRGYNISAKEITTAQTLSDEFALNQMIPFATGIRQVYSIGFNMYRTQVLDYPQNQDPRTVEFLTKPLLVLSGGVIELAEEMQKAQQIIQILSTTPPGPLQQKMFEKLIYIIFPDEADQWKQDVDKTQQLVNTLKLVTEILAQVPMEGLGPQQQQALQQIINNASQLLQEYGAPVEGSGVGPVRQADQSTPRQSTGPRGPAISG